jgi:hypothetical protein
MCLWAGGVVHYLELFNYVFQVSGEGAKGAGGSSFELGGGLCAPAPDVAHADMRVCLHRKQVNGFDHWRAVTLFLRVA